MGNRAKQQSELAGKTFLRDALLSVEKEFQFTLKNKPTLITHDPTLGDATENVWIELLKEYLPARYCVNKAFAIDHLGNTTDQLDCLIYDSYFTPKLFGQDNHIYVPAEAVYASFEIKPSVNAAHLKYAAKKAASIRKLKRTSVDIQAANGKNLAQPPFQLICGLLAMKVDWKDGLGTTFLKNLSELSGDEELNFIITASHGFYEGYNDLKETKIVYEDGALIRGLFRLLTALRDKGSVPAIDWDKYEEALSTSITSL